MDAKISNVENVLVAEIEGRIDGVTAQEFEATVTSNIPEGGTPVVCDLSSVSYVSSAGLRAILVIAKRLSKTEASFSICGLSGSVAEVFRVSGFDKIIKVHGSREDALAEVKA